MKSLQRIQQKLKAPKNQYNSFSKFYYRSTEDILEALKPLLLEEGLVMTMSDKIETHNDKSYLKATISLYKDDKLLTSNSAYAREALVQKGMNDAQITGSTSSYARKYALNGLFLIDDTKEIDEIDNTNKEIDEKNQFINSLEKSKDIDDLQITWSFIPAKLKNDEKIKEVKNKLKEKLMPKEIIN